MLPAGPGVRSQFGGRPPARRSSADPQPRRSARGSRHAHEGALQVARFRQREQRRVVRTGAAELLQPGRSSGAVRRAREPGLEFGRPQVVRARVRQVHGDLAGGRCGWMRHRAARLDVPFPDRVRRALGVLDRARRAGDRPIGARSDGSRARCQSFEGRVHSRRSQDSHTAGGQPLPSRVGYPPHLWHGLTPVGSARRSLDGCHGGIARRPRMERQHASARGVRAPEGTLRVHARGSERGRVRADRHVAPVRSSRACPAAGVPRAPPAGSDGRHRPTLQGGGHPELGSTIRKSDQPVLERRNDQQE